MHSSSFRRLVDEGVRIIDQWPDDIARKYEFLGLPETGNYTTRAIDEELYNHIHGAFGQGSIKIANLCIELMGELIYEEILDGLPIEPYCEILAKIKDATQSKQTVGNDGNQEWRRAIEYAHISAQQLNLGTANILRQIYTRHYAIGFATARLRRNGYSVNRDGSRMILDEKTELHLVAQIEKLVSEFGGLYILKQIDHYVKYPYDEKQEQYHFIAQRAKPTDPLPVLFPLGYLFQLCVKHFYGGRIFRTTDIQKFELLMTLIQDYTTLLDVQDYSFFPHFPFIPNKIIEALQKKALGDFIYKIPQARGSDVAGILLGLTSGADLGAPFEKGWTIRQAIEVIDVILSKLSTPGLTRIRARDVSNYCPSIPSHLISVILDEVLSHPHAGANQHFSKPTDAPSMPSDRENPRGPDFSQLPLLKSTDQSYVILNRSFCSGAFIESIFRQLRKKSMNFDRDHLGKALEDFVRKILMQRNIQSYAGFYHVGKVRFECDTVIETNDVIIIIEMKKKPLTRRARAGSDISVVLDLAQSLLEAQQQAGNHEVILRRQGYIDLEYEGEIHKIERKGRRIERIALSLTDFGSFHDRMFLEKFLNAVITLKFNTTDPKYKKQFKDINQTIMLLREQNKFLYPEDEQHHRPYFNCWFFSLPQLMIILDNVYNSEELRSALWAIRGISNGHGDLCFDIRHAEIIKATRPDWYEAMLQMADREKTFVTGL